MIKGEQIILRAVELADAELLYQWENNMSLWQVSNTLVPFSKYQLEKYIRSTSLDIYQTHQLRLIIEFTDQSLPEKTIGMIDLFDFDPFHNRAGLGILIHESFRGKGLAKKALQLFINYAFDVLGIHNLYCNVAQSNEASIHLFKNLGFTLIGTKKEWLKVKNGYDDELLFQLIKP